MMTTGGQPRGRRLRGQTKVRRPEATQHSGDDEDGEHDDEDGEHDEEDGEGDEGEYKSSNS